MCVWVCVCVCGCLKGCVCMDVCMYVRTCLGPFSQQLHDWGRMSVEGQQDSSLTALLFQQKWCQRSMLEMCCWVQEVSHPTALQVVEDLYLVCPRRISITFYPPTSSGFTFSPFSRYLLTQTWEQRRLYFLISAQSIQTWWCIDLSAAWTFNPRCTFSRGHSAPEHMCKCTVWNVRGQCS